MKEKILIILGIASVVGFFLFIYRLLMGNRRKKRLLRMYEILERENPEILNDIAIQTCKGSDKEIAVFIVLGYKMRNCSVEDYRQFQRELISVKQKLED